MISNKLLKYWSQAHTMYFKHRKTRSIENPSTDHFLVLLSSFFTLNGIVRGYYHNLVVPCFEGKVLEGPDFVIGKNILKLECIIPNKIELATRSVLMHLFGKSISPSYYRCF